MAATNKIQLPPDGTADTEARKLVRLHQQTNARLNAAGNQLLPSNGGVGSRVAGSQVGGQTSVSGGSV